MSTEQNKALCRRIFDEVFNQGKMNVVDELVVPDFIENEELPPGMPSGREGLKAIVVNMRSAFPDFKATVDDLIAEGDKVMVRSTWSGTQKGEFMGIPATGKGISFPVFDVIRLVDGRMVEHWGLMDSMTMMQQLGVVPVPEHA